jgi:vacuolar-type H+-ATPase subunit F/Vma7
MVCISRSNDIAIGMRLAGIQSFFIRNENEIKEKIKELSKDKDVGIINVTEEVYEIAKNELEKISNEQELPLVAKIPNTK